jgi:hypothetical protein
MNRHRFGLLVVAAAMLAGCSDTREILGQGKRSPDEFAVYSRVPLSMPPNYGLRPPGAGAGSTTDPGSATTEARRALLSGAGAAAVPEASVSPGTYALLERTGGLRADPKIRGVVNEESTILAEADQSLTERLMFWRTVSEYGTVVDPTEEAKRIRENQALGKPVTEGRTPTIERRRRALLEGILD